MIKRSLTYEDLFTEENVTQDYYFHLSNADIIRIMGRDREGDWEKYVQNIVNSGDADKIFNFIEDIIKQAVGKRTPDGLFIKPREYAEAFVASEAYGELVVELIQNPEAAKEFFQGVVGKKQAAAQKKQLEAVAGGKGGKRHNHRRK